MTRARYLNVHVRAGGNLNTDVGGTYVILNLDGQRGKTKPAKGVYPVFNQDVTFSLPDAEPDEEPPMLKVKVKQNNYLRFDKTVGKGTLIVPLMYGPGLHECKVPLSDEEGTIAGFVHLGVEVVEGSLHKSEYMPKMPPGGVMAGLPLPTGKASVSSGGNADLLPSATTTPVSGTTGSLAPGQIADPSQAAYGVF